MQPKQVATLKASVVKQSQVRTKWFSCSIIWRPGRPSTLPAVLKSLCLCQRAGTDLVSREYPSRRRFDHRSCRSRAAHCRQIFRWVALTTHLRISRAQKTMTKISNPLHAFEERVPTAGMCFVEHQQDSPQSGPFSHRRQIHGA